jgi:hypothetical protein
MVDVEHVAALKRELAGYETHGQSARAEQVRQVLAALGEDVERPAAAGAEKVSRRKPKG